MAEWSCSGLQSRLRRFDSDPFLGGWRGPFEGALGPVWTLLKTGLVAVLVIWIRVSWPRLRADQLQRLAWGLLVPVALAQLALTAVVVVARG